MRCASCECSLHPQSWGGEEWEKKRLLEAIVCHIFLNNNRSSCPMTSIQLSGGSQTTEFHTQYNYPSKDRISTILFLTFTDVMKI